MKVRAPLALALLLFSAEARAQAGFAVNRFEPAERGSGWLVVDALDLRGLAGRAQPAIGVTLEHAYKPLVVYDARGDERLALVRHQLFAHLGGSVVLLERLRLGLSVPLAIYQDGETARVSGQALAAATAPALGDVRLAADVRAVGSAGDPFVLGLGVRAWMPTGVRSQLTSDGALRVGPQILAAGELGAFGWAARTAIVLRAHEADFAGAPLGSELTGAIGGGVRSGRFFVGPELFASTGLRAPFGARETPADALLGVRCDLPLDLHLSAGVGAGLTRGYGSPALRTLLALEWWTSRPTAPPDRDHDGVLDPVDACGDVPGVPSGDPETNGCPLPEPVPREDTDRDGIWDGEDACPGLPGVRTNDAMTNGCPEGTPRQLAIVTQREIRIGEQIPFATASAELVVDGDAVLEAVRKVLDEHREIRKVRVEGHTDDTGDASFNDELSRRRAAAVVRWLVDHGVDASRLESEGYGSRRPIDTNETETGRANNRRVAFTIVERDARR